MHSQTCEVVLSETAVAPFDMSALDAGNRLVHAAPVDHEASQGSSHMRVFTSPLEEIAPGVAFAGSFANVTIVNTKDGLVLVDTGGVGTTERIIAETKRLYGHARAHTAIYTHGHIDHVFGIRSWEKERPVHVIAHAKVARRFDRYKLTRGYNGWINARQFKLKSGPKFPGRYRYPDRTYQDRLDICVGGTSLELYHAEGETDDATWVWLPASRVLCAGDMFIWAFPNCGNPQKVQRFPTEWAAALREMAAKRPLVLLPGHGPPVSGEENVQLVLVETAEALECIIQQTLRLMNEGKALNEVEHAVKLPERFRRRSWLQAVYDEPRFVVRNLWRRYGGWYDGNPAHLKPARDAVLAQHVCAAAVGGARGLARRAKDICKRIQLLTGASEIDEALAVACQLVQFARDGSPDDPEVQAAYEHIFAVRAETSASTMSRGIFSWAAAPLISRL